MTWSITTQTGPPPGVSVSRWNNTTGPEGVPVVNVAAPVKTLV